MNHRSKTSASRSTLLMETLAQSVEDCKHVVAALVATIAFPDRQGALVRVREQPRRRR